MDSSDKEEVVETISDINRKNIIELRKKNGKGVTATVSVVLLMSITVAAAGSFYITTNTLMDESEQEVEITNSAPIVVESCWANRSGTYFSVRNDQPIYSLNTEDATVYVGGERRDTNVSKDTVRPQGNFRMGIDGIQDDYFLTRVEVQDYYSEHRCGRLMSRVDANFQYNPSPPQTNEIATFTDTSNGIIDSYNWEIDGSDVGTGEELDNTFTDTGLHEVTLEVEDIRGDTDSITKDVNIIPDDVPYFELQIDNTNSPVKPGNIFEVDYTVENRGPVDQQAVRLNIEDEGYMDSNTHTLNEGETNSSTLEWTTSNTNQCNLNFDIRSKNETKESSLNIFDPSSLNADFSVDNDNPTVGETVDFTDQSSIKCGTINSYNWDFDDGSGSSISSPSHSWGSTGTYQVELEVQAYGNTDIATDTITVDPSTSPPPPISPTPLSSGALLEKGGEDNGTIQNITTPTQSLVDDLALFHDTENMCIGSGCTSNEGAASAGIDSDIYVNETGDGMTGSLHVRKILLDGSGTICIGQDCASRSGVSPSGPALSDDNTDTDTEFKLEVSTIKPPPGESSIQIE